MSATFWAWFFGLYAAFATGLFLVVAIGSHQIIEQLKDRIDLLVVERDAALGETGPHSDTPIHDELAVARLRKGLDAWGQP